MSYTKHEFKSGEKLYASELNEMDEQIEYLSNGANPQFNQFDTFLRVNNLDSSASSKTNVLLTPYDYDKDGFLNNSIILSNGTIRTDSNNIDKACLISPLIAVSEGTYGLKVVCTTSGTLGNLSDLNEAYGLFAEDGVTPVSKVSRVTLDNNIYLFVIPKNAKYIRFVIQKGTSNDENLYRTVDYFNQWVFLPDATESIDDSFFEVAIKKDNGEIKKLRRADGSYLEIVDDLAREALESIPLSFGRRTCAIFKKVCCIGDSYTAGYIMNSSGIAISKHEYSWVKHLENMTGREYVNCGVSGSTAETWLTAENGLEKMQLPENKAQAYLIGLQINDAQTGLTVGTVDDIGTETKSYYGCMSKIIDSIFAVNDKAHIFIMTQPKNYIGEHTEYRTALINIVNQYQNNGTNTTQVHLLDLLDYYKLFQGDGCNNSMVNGHFTAVGWEYCAEIIMYAWSKYINSKPLVFQDVNLIDCYIASEQS